MGLGNWQELGLRGGTAVPKVSYLGVAIYRVRESVWTAGLARFTVDGNTR